MEDSSLFMQWTLSTLQEEHPPGPASDDGFSSSSLPEVNSMVPSEPPPREGHRATSSWSSGDTDSGSGGGRSGSVAAFERDGWSRPQNSATMYAAPLSSSGTTNQQVSWNFSSGSAPPGTEATRVTVGVGLPHQMVQKSLPTRRIIARSSSGSPYVQHHILAERKRREKINQRFIELSTVIPGLKKMDKATILSDATRYVKELQGKVKAYEEDGFSNDGRRNMESVALAKKKPRITMPPDNEDGSSSPSCVAVVLAATRGALPEIEARISEGNVTVRIHCEDVKGSLVRLLVEVEQLHLIIVHANAMPFSASTMLINIMTKMEGFNNTTADDIVNGYAMH